VVEGNDEEDDDEVEFVETLGTTALEEDEDEVEVLALSGLIVLVFIAKRLLTKSELQWLLCNSHFL
jgi:hypothetical protein